MAAPSPTPAEQDRCLRRCDDNFLDGALTDMAADLRHAPVVHPDTCQYAECTRSAERRHHQAALVDGDRAGKSGERLRGSSGQPRGEEGSERRGLTRMTLPRLNTMQLWVFGRETSATGRRQRCNGTRRSRRTELCATVRSCVRRPIPCRSRKDLEQRSSEQFEVEKRR